MKKRSQLMMIFGMNCTDFLSNNKKSLKREPYFHWRRRGNLCEWHFNRELQFGDDNIKRRRQ